MSPQRAPRSLAFALAAVLVAAFAAACSFGAGDDSEATPTSEASPSSTASTTATATASPTPLADAVFLNARPVEVLETRSEIPRDLALVVERGGELWRFHQPVSGPVEERLLFDPFAYSSNLLISFWNIHQLGATLPAGQLAIAACSTGECSGTSGSSDDAQVTIFRSRDGGVSWEPTDELDGVATIVAGSTLDSFVLQRLAREGDSRTGRYEWWPSRQVIDPPGTVARDASPVTIGFGALGSGEIAWWTSDGRLVRESGAALLDLNDELSGGSAGRGIAALPNEDGSRLAVTWVESSPAGGDDRWRWSIYQRSGDAYEVMDILDAPFTMVPTAWLGDTTLLVNGDFAAADVSVRLPAALDVVAGTIEPFEVPRGSLGDGWAVAAQVGPFAEVNAGEGDCLNLRTDPSTDGGILRCIAHATLLERLSPLDAEWVNVRTADGVTGWVSGEFVRRAGSSPAATPTATASPEPAATATPEDS